MSDVYTWHAGDSPLLVSIPHDGREIPPEIAARMTARGRAIPDTDWHVRKLYEFVTAAGVNLLAANYSRYVVDLNRPASDEALYAGQVSTGLCPDQTFAGEPIYEAGYTVDRAETERRIEQYWRPYHRRIGRALAEIRAAHGFACLWEAHSIRSEVPRLFPGELPGLNIGTDDGRSCPGEVLDSVLEAAERSPFPVVANGRFKGGYITRHYAQPDASVYSLQLEVAQRCYMDEAALDYDGGRAAEFIRTARDMLAAYVSASRLAAGADR
jgi:N-formylglutamate deformylase